MPKTRKIQLSFSGGEIDTQMYGRIDAQQYQSGLATCKNWLVDPRGSLRRRPGFQRVASSLDSTKKSRLIPFTYSVDQQLVVELTDLKARFHTNGQTLVWADFKEFASTGVSTELNSITFNDDHGFADGDAIVFYAESESFSDLPPPFTDPDGSYFVKRVDARSIQVFNKSSDGEIVPITGTGTASKKFYAFSRGSTDGRIGNARIYKDWDDRTTPGSATAFFRDPGIVGSSYLLDFTGLNDPGDRKFYQGEAVELVDQDGNFLAGFPKIVFVDYFAGNASALSDLQFGLRTKEEYVNTSSNGLPNTWIDRTQLAGAIQAQSAVNHILLRQHWRRGEFAYIPVPAYATSLQHTIVRISEATNSANNILINNPQTNALANAFVVYIENKSAKASDDGAVSVTSPFSSDELFDVEYDQSGDVVTLTHPNHKPHDLRRYGSIDWDIEESSFVPEIEPPTFFEPQIIRGTPYKVTDVSTSNSPSMWKLDDTTLAVAPFAVGDITYLRNSAGTLADGYYEIAATSASSGSSSGGVNQIGLRSIDNGELVDSGTISGGFFYYVASASSDPNETYVVTSVNERGQESLGSEEKTATDNVLTSPGAENILTWAAVEGAQAYNVYKKLDGTFGVIGRVDFIEGATSYSFVDDGIGPSMSDTLLITDKQVDDTFRPRASARFEQRRCFGGSDALPRTLFMSRSGTESSFSYRIPTQASDRISVDLASREAHVIRHIVPIQDLLLLTQQGEFRVTAINSDAITPSTIAIRQQSYVGSNNVHPQVVNNSVVFCSARGGHAREINFRIENQGYLTGDLSLRAAHLFDGFTLNDLAYSKAPVPVLWFVSSSGKLLCLTYIPEERVLAWHQHETDGTIESVCSLSEGNYDNIYAVVLRGNDRSVERMVQVREETLNDAVYLDASVSKDGTNTTSNQLSVAGSGLMKAGESVTVKAFDSTGSEPLLGLFSSNDSGDVVELASGTSKYRVKLDSFIETTQQSGFVHHSGDTSQSTSGASHWPTGTQSIVTLYDSPNHTIANDEKVRITTTGSLPTGGSNLSSSTDYYALEVTQTASFNTSSFRGVRLTATSNPFQKGETVRISTTGTLPSPLDSNTDYYVAQFGAAGHYLLYPTRELAIGGNPGLDRIVFSGGSGTVTVRRTQSLRLEASTSSGTGLTWTAPGSGVHSIVRSVFTAGAGQAHGLITGDAIRTMGVVPGGLDASSLYFVIKNTNEELRFASSVANANAGTAIQLTSPPSTDTLTITIGDVLPESAYTGTLLDDLPRNLANTPTSAWAFSRKTFSGFSHLANQTISVLIDGAKTESVTVSATGTITLADYAVKICGGLSYTSQAKTLPMSLEMEAGSQGRTKNINQVSIRVEDCGALKVGMDEADLKSVDELKDTELKTGEFRTHVPSTWDEEGQIVVEATGAAPASLLNITTQVAIGD